MQLYEDFVKTPIFLGYTASQKAFVKDFFKQRNLFLTGEAGTGKSFLMNTLFDFAQKRGLAIAKTASTGIAAFNIGGQTLHSWAGLGLAEEDVQGLLGKIRKNKKALERIRAVKILVIDEVSMISSDLLDKVDAVFRYFRYNEKPFGGIQMIFVGDFCQLPPVWKGDEKKNFAFKALSWERANIRSVVLKEKVRQNADTPFAKLLSEIRIGNTENLGLLSTRINISLSDDGIEPVRIYCKNIDVNEYNHNRLSQIQSKSHFFYAKDSGLPHHIEAFNKNCPAPTKLELKIGAQVMLLSNENVEIGLVNGSIGVVKAFGTAGITVKFKTTSAIICENEWQLKEQEATISGGIRYKVVATRMQYPLKLAYAATTHKIQGMTLDRAIVDMNEAFAAGQVYTALSRVRDIESLSVVDFPSSAIRVNQDCLDFYSSLKDDSQRGVG